MPRHREVLTLILCISLVAIACGSRRRSEAARADSPPHAQATQVLKEFAIHGHEVMSFRACGQDEPFWAAWVSEGGIVLKVPGREDRTWPDIDEHRLDQGFLYTGTGPSGTVEVRIIDKPCRDSMSGAYFAYSAEVKLGPEEFVGCALKGTGHSQN